MPPLTVGTKLSYSIDTKYKHLHTLTQMLSRCKKHRSSIPAAVGDCCKRILRLKLLHGIVVANLRRQQILIYALRNGRTPPYDKWYDSLDGSAKSKIILRLSRVEKGNFGDCRSVNSIFELRFREGFRIYFAWINITSILLRCGGTKSKQQRDIERAKDYWKDYQERRNE